MDSLKLSIAICSVLTFINLMVLALTLKLYTEWAKEKFHEKR